MTEESKDRLGDIMRNFAAPTIVGLVTGYMASVTAIAVLEERVTKLEARQEMIKAQQELDGRLLTRIETKLDMLLTRSVTE